MSWRAVLSRRREGDPKGVPFLYDVRPYQVFRSEWLVEKKRNHLHRPLR